MLKIGAHCYLFTDRFTDADLHFFDEVSELGMDCFELSSGDDVHFNAANTAAHAQKCGLDLILGPGGLWPMDCDLSSEDPEEREKGLAWHIRQVELAAELNAIAYTGALYGHPGQINLSGPTDENYRWAAEGLNKLAERGHTLGCKLVIEPMSHFRSHMVNKPEQALDLLNQSDHDNLYILLDTYHLVTEITDYRKAILFVKEKLWGLHACENNRGCPGTGIIPWDDIWAALKAINFESYILLETYNSSIDDFAKMRRMFHDVCPSGMDFSRQGLAFIKAGMSS
ncbi:MAG: sugar phosphate isomerase/epimerase [Lentisphaeria bacterium]|nr:sugar phosphate isomerase/epimerase [Lentisphaeria bacterium]